MQNYNSKFKINWKFECAFTLIELLVVISIIGILAAIGLNTYPRAQAQARDRQRQSDLRQYQAALEAFANNNSSFFPSSGNPGVGIDTVLLCPSTLGSYMASCITDPTAPTRRYEYKSNGTGALGSPTATRYTLIVWGALEAPLPIKTWVVCWNGNSGLAGNSWPDIDAFCPP